MSMETGTHTYGDDPGSEAHRTQRQATDPFSLPADMDPRALPDPTAASLAAQRREAIPTLAEVMAAMPQATQADGGLMPAKLAARGDRGFGGADENRDSADAERLTALVRDMDRLISRYNSGQDSEAFVAAQAARFWTAIRDITQANTDRPNREVTP